MAKDQTVYTLTVTFQNTIPADVFIDAREKDTLVTSKEVYLVQVVVARPDLGKAFVPGKTSDLGTHNPETNDLTVQYGIGVVWQESKCGG